ncbi:hypothetical protein E8E14_014979 [Neopestalotiopsis sp. 37M]|nr:hypothetical protein E8E14_014979 [Neopestalotiopsis sp. 37M]
MSTNQGPMQRTISAPILVQEPDGFEGGPGRLILATTITSVTCATFVGSINVGMLTIAIPSVAEDVGLDSSLLLWPQSISSLRFWVQSLSGGKAASCICASVLLIWGAFNSFEQFMSLWFQLVEEVSLLDTSLRFLPQPVAGAAIGFSIGFLVHRVKANYIILISTVVSTVAPLLMALASPQQSYWSAAFPALTLNAIGADCLYTVSNLIISSLFEPNMQGTAGGVFNTVAQIGKTLGLAIGTLIAGAVSSQISDDIQQSQKLVYGYQAAFWFCMALCGLSVRLALFEDSDSEAELEAEAIQLQLQKGKELVKTGNTITAGKFLAAGISKLKHHRSRFLDAERKLFMLDDLLQPLEEQENWPEAKRIRLEKLSVLSSDMTTQSDRYLTETLELVEFLLRARDTHEGRIYARKCIKAYRKLGTDGLKGLKKALTLMISACQLEGDEPEEEVYKAMLVQLNMAPESDLTTVEASEPALPVELDAVSTEISWRSTENMEEAKSFSSKILSALSLKTIDESSQLDPPVSIAARVRRIFRSTVPCAEWYPAALDGDDTGQGNNVDGMIGANLDEYQSIHDSLKLIPVSWTETKDQEAGSLSQRLDPDMDSQDLVSDRTSLICNQHPESEMYAGGSSNQSTQDTTPSIQTEEPSSSEDLNDTKTDIMSIYELDAGPVAAVDTDSTANHGDSRSSPPRSIEHSRGRIRAKQTRHQFSNLTQQLMQ